MLYLSRKKGESIMIGDDVEIVVTEIKGNSVKLGFQFPKTVSVLRREVFDRIQLENRAAIEGDHSTPDILHDLIGKIEVTSDKPSSS